MMRHAITPPYCIDCTETDPKKFKTRTDKPNAVLVRNRCHKCLKLYDIERKAAVAAKNRIRRDFSHIIPVVRLLK